MVSKSGFETFHIDDDEDDLRMQDNELEFDDFDNNNGNPDIDYYPGLSNNNRHSLLVPEDFHSKWTRLLRKFKNSHTSVNSRKLLLGLAACCLVVVFFTIMLFSGNGSDDKLPGGAIHNGQNNQNNDNNENNSDLNDSLKNNDDHDLMQLSLDDMRKGSYWVFDYNLHFIDYEPIDNDSSLQKRDHKDGHKDKDKDHDHDDDDDDDDDHDDDDDKKDHNDDDDDDEHEDEDKNKNKNKNKEHDKSDDDDNDEDEDEEKEKENKKEKETEPQQNNDPGYYIHQSNSVIWLKKASNSDYNKKIIDLESLTFNGSPIQSRLVSYTKSLDKIIVVSNQKSIWRHSSVAKYWLVDVNTLNVEPVYYSTTKIDSTESKVPIDLNYAAFSPSKNYIYFNYENNLWIKDLKKSKFIQVTKDGDKNNIRNGRPDWVYEEEVLGEDRAIYWTEDDSKFAFIKFDDTDVPIYNLEIFSNEKYPEIEQLKYPKPGFSNPIVSLYVYQTSNNKLIKVKQPEEFDKTLESLGSDFIIYQTVWLNSDELLFKRTDRTSRKIQVCIFSVKSGKSFIVRSVNTDDYNGWYKNNGNIYVLPDNKGYIDNVVFENHDHLSHFRNSTDSEGDLITAGDWDVIDGVVGYDDTQNTIYFVGTSGNYLQRQLYKVDIEESTLIGLTDLTEIQAYSLKVSQKGKWGLMKYKGPQLPTEKIVELNKVNSLPDYYDKLKNLNNAEDVSVMLENFEVPLKTYIPIILHDNVTINIIEVKPSNFDENKKYPILVSVYGGPGIQKTNCDFNYGFEEIVSSSLDAIVLYIDPRGTGGSGWDYRSWARDNIGYHEPRDITEATERYIDSRDYIDTEKIAIWGWSYGGFTTLKTLEFDSGKIFKFGLAVAPVTNWYLYDSIYTERYMGNPKIGEYKDAKIENILNFKNVYRFLIMHGTADDNVHYQNTLQLLNEFDLNNVENYDVHIFPDSDHSIAHDNANTIVYDKLFTWLGMAFER